ncbi:MAG: hypothetical protein O9256_00710 [Rhizobiaceae bacterium]|nr:hypothetical protein [Rhizobiaceae bacterium]
MKELLERVLVDKAAARLKAQALAWPEKIAVIERLRDARAEALKTMRVVGRRSAASPEPMPMPVEVKRLHRASTRPRDGSLDDH